jgi:DNA replication protein DnaC
MRCSIRSSAPVVAYMAATAMIDRLIHYAEILSLKGDSYRLRGKDLDPRPAIKVAELT